jgi:hypothetical protein
MQIIDVTIQMSSINKHIMDVLTSHNVPLTIEDGIPIVNSAHLIGIVGNNDEITEMIEGLPPTHVIMRKVTTYDTGPVEIKFLTPKGLYRLFMYSDAPATRRFQDWLEDVIDNVSETGKYTNNV